MTRVLDAITAQPWAITQEALSTILSVARREADLEAVQARLGRPLANTRSVTQRGAAAIVPIAGPIFRRANLFSQISGATSIDILARDFRAALDDPAVAAIVLEIDSPGGEVAGVNAFADMVYAARGQKPIIAYVGSQACSAAYWIAAQADTIVTDATAMLGSIGVVMAMPTDRADGELEFTSSQSPNKRPDVGSSAGRQQMQQLIDATADVFIAAVSRGRGVSAETVVADFGAGGVLVGEAAVQAGMADRVGSLEDILAAYEQPGARRVAPELARLLTAKQQAADAIVAALPSFDVPLMATAAAVPVIPDTRPTTTAQEPPMSDTPEPTGAPEGAPAITMPPLPQLNDAAMQQQLAAYSAAMQSQLQAQYQQLTRQAEQQAAAQFQRWQAEQEARQAILTYAQHATTPTLDRPHALPFSAEQVVNLLSALPAANRPAVQQALTDILDSGLVPFDRIGSGGGGEEAQSAREQFDALMLAKTASGMSYAAALKAVAKDRPDLYNAQSTLKGGR
jgi:ClpP class serine protease